MRTDRNGICGRSSFTNRARNWFPSLNVVIRGNLLEDIGGDCIKPWGCDGCLVEYNVVRGGRPRNTKIYNNVFYVPEGRDIYAVLCTDWNGWAQNTHFCNNIFYVDGKVRYEFGQSTNNVFERNVFYGTHENRPNDPSAILADPMFINAGSGGDGLDSLKGYKLKPGSPCIDAGLAVDNCGERDFWGGRLRENAKPDIGAQAVNP